MQSNSSESNNYDLPGAASKKPSNLGRVGLCFSVAGLFGVITASFVTCLEHLPVPLAIIVNVTIILNLLSVPGSLISLVALYGAPPRRAAFWGVMLALVGIAYLPTMLIPWIRR
jgi:hypothetical protein